MALMRETHQDCLDWLKLKELHHRLQMDVLGNAVTESNHEPQSSWWLQVPIWELPFRNHFQNFPMLFRTRKYWKCYDCIRLTLLSSSSYSIYYYTLELSSRIITTILYKHTSTHSIYIFTLVTNTSIVFTHLRQWLR